MVSAPAGGPALLRSACSWAQWMFGSVQLKGAESGSMRRPTSRLGSTAHQKVALGHVPGQVAEQTTCRSVCPSSARDSRVPVRQGQRATLLQR